MESYKNVYTVAEYKQLRELNEAALEQNKILKRQLDDACADLAKHAHTILDLQNEKLRLQQEVDHAMDRQQTVELPRKVAISVEHCREAGMSNLRIIASLRVIPQLFRDYDSSVLDSLNVIHDYSKKLGSDERLLEALINGYTIKQTPEERLREKLRDSYNVWAASPSNGPDEFEQDQNELFDLITDAVKQIYQTETMT
ncbi:hypothetical protein NYE54_08330 [Paenibacillus sp. FSL K6-1330]|uniref:hypothetical protein n=1 Tax=Paenibacillus sp. FSL K6-1330 TaxID=2975292 RepID=UPI0030DCD3AA